MTTRFGLLIVLSVVVTWFGAARQAAAQVSTSQVLSQGYLALEKKDYGEAQRRAHEVLEFNPYNFRALGLLAAVYEGQREFRRALSQYNIMVARQPSSGEIIDHRGAIHFYLGHIDAAIADFDSAIKLEEKRAADHWRRGIALYYAGRFKEGADQFASGQGTSANDVENALWHFACVARTSGVEEARKSMFPLGEDARAPMKELYALYSGKGTDDEVVAAVNSGDPKPEEMGQRYLYSFLYLGLYHEVMGDKELAKKFLGDLVEKMPLPGVYMWEVGRVHYDRIRAGK